MFADELLRNALVSGPGDDEAEPEGDDGDDGDGDETADE